MHSFQVWRYRQYLSLLQLGPSFIALSYVFVSLWVFVFVFVFVCVYSSLIISKCPRLPLIVNISARSKPQLPNWTFQHHTRPKISNSWRWHQEKILVCTLISLGRDKLKGFLMCAPAKILSWPPLPLVIQPFTFKASQIYSISNQLSIARLIYCWRQKETNSVRSSLTPFRSTIATKATSSNTKPNQHITKNPRFSTKGVPPPRLKMCLPKFFGRIGGYPHLEKKTPTRAKNGVFALDRGKNGSNRA